MKLIEIKIIRHKPGKLLGAGAGDISVSEFVSLEGAGEGASPICSLSHNSEQLVFQNLFIVTVIGHKCITNNDACH